MSLLMCYIIFQRCVKNSISALLGYPGMIEPEHFL